jgi:hypothetical protein
LEQKVNGDVDSFNPLEINGKGIRLVGDIIFVVWGVILFVDANANAGDADADAGLGNVDFTLEDGVFLILLVIAMIIIMWENFFVLFFSLPTSGCWSVSLYIYSSVRYFLLG